MTDPSSGGNWPDKRLPVGKTVLLLVVMIAVILVAVFVAYELLHIRETI